MSAPVRVVDGQLFRLECEFPLEENLIIRATITDKKSGRAERFELQIPLKYQMFVKMFMGKILEVINELR